MEGEAAASAEVVDLSGLGLEGHVRRALQRARELSGGTPLSAADLLKAAVAVGGSDAFTMLATLLPWSERDAPPPSTASDVSVDVDAIPVGRALAGSFSVAWDFLAAGKAAVWGRDYVTIALLARDDPSLVELAQETGTQIDVVRREWLQFLTTQGRHRSAEEWKQWWRAAGFPTSAEPPPHTALPLSATVRGVQSDLASGPDPTTTGITAFDIAQAIARRHPEYAGRRIAPERLDAPEGARRLDWDTWSGSVGSLLDGKALEASRHKVLDGRLLLVGLGLLENPLRQRLEDLGAWGPLLLEIDESVASAGSALGGALRAVQLRHGYSSDSVGGEDRLGIRGEVNALCEVLLDPEVRPPLAVGLFGEWGSGKSFFMERMRHRVARLTAGPDRTREMEVVQIRFNAWHYADTSLWASLAVEIFERLADPEPAAADARQAWIRDHGDPRRAQREELLTHLESYRSAKSALDTQLERLEAERRKTADRRDAAVRKRAETVRTFPLTDVASELAKDGTVRGALDRIGDSLGLTPAVGELTTLAAELRTTAGYVPAVWRRTKHKPLAIGLVALFAVLALATAGLLARAGTDLGAAVWGAALTTAAAVASAVTAASRFLRPAVRAVNEALAVVEAGVRTASSVEARLRAERSREELQLTATLEDLDREIAETGRTLAVLEERIASTQAEADALSVGRQLYDFLADRAAGYQKHQGVVGMLHRDFRFLDAQLLAYKETTQRLPGLPAIDRVILYIDDLDRCPPAKVLEVLEAVHLLLALELFVVVVGVDPRWLQRSLRHQYRDLVVGGDPADDAYLRVMPIEYLEKIFQIPLTLPAMEPAAYGQLVASLAPSVKVAEPPREPEPTATRRTSVPDGSPAGRVPTRALLEVQPGSSASGAGGSALDLTPHEVEYAQSLGHLLDTPRAAKRLMNTYRLIRATQHVGSRSRFLGSDGRPGEYQAVLTLLAVAAGYPTLADPLLVALEEDAPKHGVGDWTAFLDGIDPTGPGALLPAGPDPAEETTNPAAALRGVDVAAWHDLHRGLVESRSSGGLEDLEPYRRWGRIVARFSFTL